MTGALLLILLPLLVAAWVLQIRAMEQRLKRLEAQAASLSQRFFALSLWSEVLEKRLQGDPSPVVARISAAPPEAPASPPPPLPERSAPLPAQPAQRLLPSRPRPPVPRQVRQALLWKRIEGLVVENWSGLLGVLVVVAGATFMIINAGLQLEARERFLLTLLVGATLGLPSLLWGRQERWRDLTDGLRSGGGALVLFACAAAGGLPRLGLQWIEAPTPALTLLAVGVGLNLALAAVARTPAIASLHVAVSLVPLAIGPQGATALAIASAIALLGYGLPPAHRWERHRLVVLWVYALFQGIWFLRNGAELGASPALAGGAALAAVLVFGRGLLDLHRRGGALSRLKSLPLALLISQWGGLGLALLVYPRTAASRAAALAMAAALALLLARGARRRGEGWLALGDGLVGQTLVVASLISLAPLIADGPVLAVVLLAECLLFLAIGVREQAPTIRRIGWWLSVLAGLLLALTGLGAALLSTDPTRDLQTAAVLTSGAALLSWAQVLLRRHGVPLPQPPLLGWLAGVVIFVGTALVGPEPWRSGLSLVVMGAFLLAARRWRPPGLLLGVSGAVAAAHGITWLRLLAREPMPATLLLPQLLPLIGLALLLMIAAAGSRQQRLGLGLLGLDAGLGALLLLDPISPLLPGTAWLLLGSGSLAATRRLRGASVQAGLVLTLVYLVGFLASYLLVIGPSLELVQVGALEIRGRWLIELLAIAVFLQGWFLRASPELARLRTWQVIQPCFLEATLASVGVIIVGEISAPWRPVAWTLLALALVAPALGRRFAVRLQVYGVIVYWLAVARLVLSLGGDLSPVPLDGGTARAAGLLAIALQGAFVVASHRWLDRETLGRPGGLPILGWIGQRVAAARNRWLYYPLFVAVAFVLASGYDRSLLTLLWTGEAIAVYLLGLGLRESQFRHLALIGLGGCLLRLLAVDMAQADLGLRGLVFIGVGLLLLALNAIVHRFRGRFD
ncbi:hypothetical protein [Synechococcus sp. CCY 9618]|uniref:hypothetical protein n=1 Tax=Synechococcus sp. CCY 9618 TaxID=2815602 RepID=UPI001C22B832|nr:hypothetical protein [Synechococcus sp. CCY 9618]